MPMDEDSKEKMGFLCRGRVYEYTTMPFGMYNNINTFQRLMNVVLGNLWWHCALVYTIDHNVHSRSFEAHIRELHIIFERFIGMKLNYKNVLLACLN